MIENPKADLSLAMIEQIQKSGRAIEILGAITNDEIFDTLSKHNPWWDDSEKLQDLRFKFQWIEDQIHKAITMMQVDPYEGSL